MGYTRLVHICMYRHVCRHVWTLTFVSLPFAFMIWLLGDWTIEVSSAVSHDVKKDVNFPQMVNP